jgi:hypothetical protein
MLPAQHFQDKLCRALAGCDAGTGIFFANF